VVIRNEARLVLTEKGKTLYELNQRKSKNIKAFMRKAIQEKWVLKRDILIDLISNSQVETITEFLQLKEKLKKEE